MHLDLVPAHCTQLSFGTDVLLMQHQLTLIRDTVLAMYPAASLPWYFRETYQAAGSTYEVAASLAQSTRSNPTKPYNVYVRLMPTADPPPQDTPSVHWLFQVLNHHVQEFIYCDVHFSIPVGSGTPVVILPLPIEQAPLADRLEVDGYEFGVFDEAGTRVASLSLSWSSANAYYYRVRFFQMGRLTEEFPVHVLRRSLDLLNRVHRSSGGIHA